MADFLRGCAGCGMFIALLSGALGAPDAVQYSLFAFGFVYGGLWLKAEERGH